MFCLKCGNELRDGAKFCAKCGTKIPVKNDRSEISTEGVKDESKDLGTDTITPFDNGELSSKIDCCVSEEVKQESVVEDSVEEGVIKAGDEKTENPYDAENKSEDLSVKENSDHENSDNQVKDGYDQLAEKAKEGYATVTEKIFGVADAASSAIASFSAGGTSGASENNDSDNKSQTEGTHPYCQLGGFLQFIVVMNYISIGLACLFGGVEFISGLSFASNYGMSVGSLLFWSLLMIIALVVMFKYALVFLAQIREKNPQFLLSFHKTLVVYTIAIILVSIVGSVSNGFIGAGYYLKECFSTIIEMGISGVILTLYFAKSVRVRTYMGSDEYLRLDPITENMPSPEPADKN